MVSTYGEVSITHSPQPMRSCQINVCSRISPFLRQWQAVIKHSSLSHETTRLNSSDILQKWFTFRPQLVFSFVSFFLFLFFSSCVEGYVKVLRLFQGMRVGNFDPLNQLRTFSVNKLIIQGNETSCGMLIKEKHITLLIVWRCRCIHNYRYKQEAEKKYIYKMHLHTFMF